MATHYNKIVEDLGNIVDAIAYYDKELEDARWEVRIKGSLEKASASLPGLTEFRFNQHPGPFHATLWAQFSEPLNERPF